MEIYLCERASVAGLCGLRARGHGPRMLGQAWYARGGRQDRGGGRRGRGGWATKDRVWMPLHGQHGTNWPDRRHTALGIVTLVRDSLDLSIPNLGVLSGSPRSACWAAWHSGSCRGCSPRHASARRRCRRCWYDLRDTLGMTCPECGRVASTEAELKRGKRRPRLAMLGVALVLYGATAAIAPWWRTGAWAGHVRTVVLMPLYPVFDPPKSTRSGYNSRERPVLSALRGRAWEGELSPAHAAALARWCTTKIEVSANPLARREAADLLFRIGPAAGEYFERVRAVLERETEAKPREALPRAAARIGGRTPLGRAWIESQIAGSTDDSTILYMLMGVPEGHREQVWYVPALSRLVVAGHDRVVSATAAMTLARMGPAAAGAIPAIERAIAAAEPGCGGRASFQCALARVRGEVSRPAEYWALHLSKPDPRRRRGIPDRRSTRRLGSREAHHRNARRGLRARRTRRAVSRLNTMGRHLAVAQQTP